MAGTMGGDVIGDFANAGVLEGDAQPTSPVEKTSSDMDDAKGRGELLDLAKTDPQETARKIKKLWELQDAAAKRRKVIWDQHKLWMMGIRGIRARPVSTDINRWELYVPPGALDMPPVLDQTESLLDKLTSHVLADQAQPECLAWDDSPDERDGAQFSERWLTVMGGEAECNDNLLFRTGEKKAGIYGSSFLYHYVDTIGWEADPDNPGQRRDRKTVCKKLLPPFYVRPIPETAKDAADADGLLVMDTTTVGDLKRRFPQILEGEDAWSAEQWATVVEWKPQASKWALPWFINTRMNKGPEFKADGTPTDTSPCVTLALYMGSRSGEYPDGCYILTAGGSEVLYAEDWLDHSDEQSPRPLDHCIVQIKQLTDDIADDFYGRGIIQMLGPIGEVRSSIVLAWLDYLDRFTHPHTFLPLGTVVQPDQLAARDGRGIFFNPQGQPVMEQVPQFPPDAKEFLDRAGQVENDIVGLYAATGESQPGVRSAEQLALQTSQSTINTTQISDNLGDAIERSWRISLQLARAFIPEPQTLRFEDEDGEYREQAWRSLDFGRANQVRIKPGTFTQMSQEAREARLIQWQQLQWITPDQAKELVASNMRAEVGLEDNPFLRKVRRELRLWRKGPNPDWLQQAEQTDAHNQSMQAVAQLTNQPPQPPTPYPPGPFQRTPVDLEQDVARWRHAELRHEICSTRFTNQPPLWQQQLVTEYLAMKQAAGVLTAAEQQQAQQAMMQQQVQAMVQEKVAPILAKGQAEAQAAQAEAVGEIQAEQRKLAQEITLLREQAALKAGAPPAQQIEQDTLLRDSLLFSATGPNVPFAPGIVGGGDGVAGAPMAPPSGGGNGPMVGAPEGPHPGPGIPGGSAAPSAPAPPAPAQTPPPAAPVMHFHLDGGSMKPTPKRRAVLGRLADGRLAAEWEDVPEGPAS